MNGGETVLPAEADWHAPYNPWLITFVATLATFMEVLDTTIVNVALPHIAGNLGADVSDSTWTLTSYLVANAMVLPLSAWFSSLIGRKRFYLTCVALFTLSSLLCGMAPTLGTLVLCRLLQGIGGGGLQPSSQAILVDTFPLHKRGMGMAAFGMTVVVAPIIGPTLGGWITDNYSWRWIFFINVPIGLLSLVLSSKFISDPPYLRRRTGRTRFKVDYIGLGLLTLGIGALQLVLDLGERYDWFDSRFIFSAAIISVIALALAIYWELRHKDPILNLRLLGERNLGMSAFTMFLFGVALYGSSVLLPMYMQTLMRYTAMLSGLAISPGGFVTLALLPFIGMMVSRIDIRILVSIGIAIVSWSLFNMGRFNLDVDFHTFMMARVFQATGFAFIFVPLNTLSYSFVAKEDRNAASSLISVTRNIGGSIGIAMASSMITRGAQVHQTYLVAHLTPYDPGFMEVLRGTAARFTALSGDRVLGMDQAYATLMGFVRGQAATLAFVDAFRLFGLLLLILIPAVWLTKKAPHATANIAPD